LPSAFELAGHAIALSVARAIVVHDAHPLIATIGGALVHTFSGAAGALTFAAGLGLTNALRDAIADTFPHPDAQSLSDAKSFSNTQAFTKT